MVTKMSRYEFRGGYMIYDSVTIHVNYQTPKLVVQVCLSRCGSDILNSPRTGLPAFLERGSPEKEYCEICDPSNQVAC